MAGRVVRDNSRVPVCGELVRAVDWGNVNWTVRIFTGHKGWPSLRSDSYRTRGHQGAAPRTLPVSPLTLSAFSLSFSLVPPSPISRVDRPLTLSCLALDLPAVFRITRAKYRALSLSFYKTDRFKGIARVSEITVTKEFGNFAS